MTAIRFEVQGRVQGVGFRWSVVRLAETHGVVGEVWNRRDGAVEGIAASEDGQTLKSFSEQLSKGPGRVESVNVFPWSADESMTDFRISFTR